MTTHTKYILSYNKGEFGNPPSVRAILYNKRSNTSDI